MKMLSKFQSLLTQVCVVALLMFAGVSSAQTNSAPKNLLVLGDSLSAEYGMDRGTGWVALLEKRLDEKKFNYKVINASISGETTVGGKSRLQALLSIHQPSIVIIELGANDAIRGLELDATATNLKEIIAMAQAEKAQVLLVAMRIPPNYGKAYTDKFFALYASVAKESKSNLVPFFLQGVADKPEMFQPDRIHLKAEAHPTMLNNVWAQLQRLLKK
ncbi:MAG: arylesterase [Burkholderiales bacterium]|nr:arylesterase [Burkholderiales bacterium]